MYCFFDFNMHFGGAQIGTISLCSNLSKKELPIIIYDAYGKDKKYRELIHSKNLASRSIYPEASQVYIGGSNILHRMARAAIQLPGFIILLHRLRRHLITDNVKLVWVNNTKSLMFIYLASLGINVRKVLYHRGWAQEADIEKPYRLLINKACDALIGHSSATVSNLKKLFPNKKVIYVPNSVEVNHHKIDCVSSRHRSANDFTIVLPAARPVKEKGHDVAVNALAELRLRGITNIKLIFPGESPLSDSGSFVKSLIKSIESQGISKQVEFIGWIDKMDSLLASCDIAILPSHTEGFPRVVIESMLVGTPVIATPVGGIPEAIIHDKTGLLINIDDHIALADCIEQLYRDENMKAQLSENAQSFAKKHFSAAVQANGVATLFNSLVKGDKCQ